MKGSVGERRSNEGKGVFSFQVGKGLFPSQESFRNIKPLEIVHSGVFSYYLDFHAEELNTEVRGTVKTAVGDATPSFLLTLTTAFL